MKISLGYPDAATERNLLLKHKQGQPVDQLQPVTRMDAIAELQKEVRNVFIDEAVADYLLNIVRATRKHPSVMLGASPRASLSLMMAGKAYAFIQQRDFVLPDDIKVLSPFVLSHRIILRPESRLDHVSAESVVKQILQQVHVPVALER